MEGFAYVAHRWVMHGFGWFLHESHHRARTGPFELNDLYAVIFAGPSILLLAGGVRWGWWPGCTWIGAGIAAYGAIYFGFHDWIVHKRLRHAYVARSGYMKRIIQAHRLHHVVETRDGHGELRLPGRAEARGAEGGIEAARAGRGAGRPRPPSSRT